MYKFVYTLLLINQKWNVERFAHQLVNLYDLFLLANASLQDSQDEVGYYFLYQIFEVEKKRRKIKGVFKTGGDFVGYSCDVNIIKVFVIYPCECTDTGIMFEQFSIELDDFINYLKKN